MFSSLISQSGPHCDPASALPRLKRSQWGSCLNTILRKLFISAGTVEVDIVDRRLHNTSYQQIYVYNTCIQRYRFDLHHARKSTLFGREVQLYTCQKTFMQDFLGQKQILVLQHRNPSDCTTNTYRLMHACGIKHNILSTYIKGCCSTCTTLHHDISV